MPRILICLLTLLLLAAGPAVAGTLDRIERTQTIRLGYRTDAPPFSSETAEQGIHGFMVDLCRAVVADLARQLDLKDLRTEYVAVTAQTRFEAIQQGRIDLLCGPTSHTLERRERVDFSIPTFNDGVGLLLRADGPQRVHELDGTRVGVLGGTTTVRVVRETLEERGVSAELVTAASHDQGIGLLARGEIAGYFGDWGILFYQMLRADRPEELRLSDAHFGTELYALALPRGDPDFRLAVDRGLARLYAGPRLEAIFERYFGSVQATPMLRAIYTMFRLPE